MNTKIIDCTLRDGGYYNNWDFKDNLVQAYLDCMNELNIDFVEIGFRSLINNGFKGAFAYSTDSFIESLSIPNDLKIGVMVNASELFSNEYTPEDAVNMLFQHSSKSPVELVRFACHIYEFEKTLPLCNVLKDMGYEVGINLMQISEAETAKVISLGKAASKYNLDVLYFADSLGSLSPDDVSNIIRSLRSGWKGPLGIHTHDNMNLALANTHSAINSGATWIDSTVTGMGRGPGNAKTEFTSLEFSNNDNSNGLKKLSELLQNYFLPLQKNYGWGTNHFYYLAGKFKIHPTYIQEMLNDERYEDEDILSLIEHLRVVGGKKFNHRVMETGRLIFQSEASGSWNPRSLIANNNVLIIGSGPSTTEHKQGIEAFIKKSKPFVIALNTSPSIDESLIGLRAACHPMRIVADIKQYKQFSQPLAIPLSQLPLELQNLLADIDIVDYGISIEEGIFSFSEHKCSLPLPLVIAYSLAIASMGGAKNIYLAGMDGYSADDLRSSEMKEILELYSSNKKSVPLISITPTKYDIESSSVYAL